MAATSPPTSATPTPATGAGGGAAEIVEALTAASAEFRGVWAEHEVARKHSKTKRIAHPEVGLVEIHCQTLYDVDQSQGLLVFTATPGSESAEKLRLLAVLGRQTI